jgi:hypothetical protein
MKVHRLFVSGALIVGALSLPAFAAAADPAAATTGTAGSASETATKRAVTALAVAPTCDSWTDFTTTPGVAFQIHIPSTTRNGSQTNCVLRPGDRGAGVFILQDALIRCYEQRMPQDGIYGEKTTVGVRNVQAFQRATTHKMLKVDSVYGQDTRAAMTFAKFKPNGEFDHCRK